VHSWTLVVFKLNFETGNASKSTYFASLREGPNTMLSMIFCSRYQLSFIFVSSPHGPHLLTSSPPHLLTSSPPHLLTSSPPRLRPNTLAPRHHRFQQCSVSQRVLAPPLPSPPSSRPAVFNLGDATFHASVVSKGLTNLDTLLPKTF
jgi:hypothetical protein